MTDLSAALLVDAFVDELRQLRAVGGEHTQGTVPAADQIDGGVDDPPQRRVPFQAGGDREDGVQQAVHLVPGVDQVVEPAVDLGQLLAQPHVGRGVAELGTVLRHVTQGVTGGRSWLGRATRPSTDRMGYKDLETRPVRAPRPRPPGDGSPPDEHGRQPFAATATGATTTGQWAWRTHWAATLPSRRSVSGRWPWLPTTSRSASAEAAMSSVAG